MRIIKQADSGWTTSYHHMWNRAEHGTGEFRSGYSFDCDASGNVDVSKLQPPARDAYEQLTATSAVDGHPFHCLGVEKIDHHYRIPAVGACNRCDKPVTLSGFTNTCDCGADYNSAGQELAPRSQWGEETGETADDILRGEAWDD